MIRNTAAPNEPQHNQLNPSQPPPHPTNHPSFVTSAPCRHPVVCVCNFETVAARSPQPLQRPSRPAVTVQPVRPAKDFAPWPQAKARPKQLPHITRGPTERPKRSLDRNVKIVLGLFFGKGELSRALCREGLTAVWPLRFWLAQSSTFLAGRHSWSFFL